MILNQQAEVPVDVRGARAFVGRLRQTLALGRREFNVCMVDDPEIKRLNARYRGIARPTDVLSFRWKDSAEDPCCPDTREFRGFLGDILISAPTARRNARAAGHSTQQEIRWLILHGLLHLLGYDHETDCGEMARLEGVLRDRLDWERFSNRSGLRGRGRGVKSRP